MKLDKKSVKNWGKLLDRTDSFQAAFNVAAPPFPAQKDPRKMKRVLIGSGLKMAGTIRPQVRNPIVVEWTAHTSQKKVRKKNARWL